MSDPYTADPPIPGFVIPEEKKAIDETYPGFKNWVDTKGKENEDWYLHPKV